MERAATSTLRRCLRSGKPLRYQAPVTPASRRCFATAICPYSQTSRSTSNRPSLNLTSSKPSPSYPSPIKHLQSLSKSRTYSTSPTPTAPSHLNPQEKEIWELLQKELEPTELEVQDISGGCGSMYGIEIVSPRFEGLGMLKQQRLVNAVLGERVKDWHGVQLRTRSS